MTLSEFLKILHSYIGVECTNQDYIPFIVTLIMRAPASDAEVQADEQNKYYPYNGLESEKDYLGRIYNGKALPKIKARMIKKYYDSSAFLDAFDDVDESARKKMIGELSAYGIKCSVETLPNVCEELIGLLIDAAAMGIETVDASLVGDGKELTLPVYDDTDLKNAYGVHLLAETKQRCPNDGCFKPLYQDADGKSAFDYTVVQINPKLPRNTVDNLIALCPECARRYMFDINTEKIHRLEDIKLRITILKEALDEMSDEKLVAGVESVLRKISQIPVTQVMELNYSPTEVVKKMDGTDASLFFKIHNFVNKYYPDVETTFIQLEMEGTVDYERFCSQMKYEYKDLAQQGLTQSQIFDKLVTWLAGLTNEETGPCEVVVSFFVQKCEVFDAISK